MPNFSQGIDPQVEIVINFRLQQLSGQFIEKEQQVRISGNV